VRVVDDAKCIVVTAGFVSVCVSLSVLRHIPNYCMDPNVTLGNGRGCPSVVQYWADLQLVHRFCCYDNIVLNTKCQRVLVLAVCLVYTFKMFKVPCTSVVKCCWCGMQKSQQNLSN